MGRREQASLPPHVSRTRLHSHTLVHSLSHRHAPPHTHTLPRTHSLSLSHTHTHTEKALDLVLTIVFIHRAFSGTGRAPSWLPQSGHQADRSGCRSGCEIAYGEDGCEEHQRHRRCVSRTKSRGAHAALVGDLPAILSAGDLAVAAWKAKAAANPPQTAMLI